MKKLFIVFFFITSIVDAQNVWMQKANLTGAARHFAVGHRRQTLAETQKIMPLLFLLEHLVTLVLVMKALQPKEQVIFGSTTQPIICGHKKLTLQEHQENLLLDYLSGIKVTLAWD